MAKKAKSSSGMPLGQRVAKAIGVKGDFKTAVVPMIVFHQIVFQIADPVGVLYETEFVIAHIMHVIAFRNQIGNGA